ncbi:MAG: signal peptidase I, partial [Nitrospinae bacterium]|nr:signal peptidase I [Nitrospinota bacterium]
MAQTTNVDRPWTERARHAAGVATFLLALGLVMMIAQGVRPLIVYSGSMSPKIRTGSIVLVKPVRAESLNVGDVISVRTQEGGHLVTHRIQAKQLVDGRVVFQTKGDANKFPDPQPFIVENAAGKVILDVPLLGYAIVYASSPLARSGVVAILAFAVLGGFRRKSKPSTASPL